ncbi:hypothetical protein SUGI_0215410 [Cryptomeria japonica]|nr:hypothetical protein SUGI_0215410 [Cryptomeria japonica]
MEKIPNSINNIVEALAFLFEVKLAKQREVKSVIFEGDSLNTVMDLKEEMAKNWKIDYIIQEIKNQLSWFDKFILAHCFREANGLADLLANKVCLHSQGENTLNQNDFLRIVDLSYKSLEDFPESSAVYKN